MIETYRYKDNWLVMYQVLDDNYSTTINYRLEKFSKYYKDIDTDDYFVIETTTYYSGLYAEEESFTKERIQIINDYSYRVMKDIDGNKLLEQYTGRPSVASRK